MAAPTVLAAEEVTEYRTPAKVAGDRKLYKLSRPVVVEVWGEDNITAEYIIISAAGVSYSGPETYVFPADEDGEIINWAEMPGSFKGDLDHDRALAGFLSAMQEVTK